MKKLLSLPLDLCNACMNQFVSPIKDRCVEKSNGMLDRMPDSFPPKRMINNLEAIRKQNERILKILEKRSRASGKKKKS